MKVRLFWCIWYFFFIGHGLDVCVSLMAPLHQPHLSAVCADHQCGCTFKGSCEIKCCCATAFEEVLADAATDKFFSCGGEEPELFQPKSSEPHFPSGDMMIAFGSQSRSMEKSLDYEPRWRPLEPPMKVPIT